MSKKKRLAWKPVTLVYDQMRKEKRKEISKDEFDRILGEISQHQAVIHLLMSRLIEDVEIINDDLKHIGAKNDDIADAYNSAVKWVNRSVDLVEPNLPNEVKGDFLSDHETLKGALDWFCQRHKIEMNPKKKRDIQYRARFAGSKPYKTIEERRAFEDGFVIGCESEINEKMEMAIDDGEGNVIFVEQSDMARWLEKYCQKNGVPQELIHYENKKQVEKYEQVLEIRQPEADCGEVEAV